MIRDSDVREWLEAALSGRMDDLTPEQMDAVQEWLARDAEAAREAAASVPAPPVQLPPVPEPDPATWDVVYERIEAGLGTVPTAAGPTPRVVVAPYRLRTARTLAALGAVAACALLGLFWRLGSRSEWTLELADHSVVLELDVSGPATSFVAYSNGTAVILVLEEDESESAGGA